MARIRLESLLCEHAAVRVTQTDLTVLQACMTSWQRGRREPRAYLALHRQFHFTVYAAAAMPAVTSMVEMLWLRLGPLMHRSNVGQSAVIDQGFHARLLRALEVGDAPRSGRVVQEDIEASCHLVVRYLTGCRTNELSRRPRVAG